MPKVIPFAFENLGPPRGPGRGPVQIARELGALANNVNTDRRRAKPKAIGLCEAIGYTLPDLWRYGQPIRDRSTPSRANLACYLLERLDRTRVRWLDLAETWPRSEHPGTHEPRSILTVEVAEWRLIVAHAPPVSVGTGPARREWLDAMVDLMSVRATPVLALTDPNGLGDDLAQRVGGGVVRGTPVEAANGRGVYLDSVRSPGIVNGVPMLTDHRRALLGRAIRKD